MVSNVGCPKIVNIGTAKTDMFYEQRKYGFKKRWGVCCAHIISFPLCGNRSTLPHCIDWFKQTIQIAIPRLYNTLHLHVLLISINPLLPVFSLHLYKLHIDRIHRPPPLHHAAQTLHHIINASSTSHPNPSNQPLVLKPNQIRRFEGDRRQLPSTFPAMATLDVTKRCSTSIPNPCRLSNNSLSRTASSGTKNAVLHDPFDRSFIPSLPGRFPRESAEERVWLC